MRLIAFVLAALALVFSTPAQAQDMEYREGPDWIRTSEAPCMYAGVLQHIPEGIRPQFQKAQASVNGVRYFGCWRPMGNVIHLFYEDGDQGIVPVADLKPVKES